MNKEKVLFVCIHNSGRSQMAEALLRHLGGEHFEASSAGFEPGTLNPIVVEVLKEIGIDISQAKTKSVFDLHKQGRKYQYVVTVCDESKAEICPIFPGLVRSRVHWSFRDPSSLHGSREERLAKTRVVRDQIKAKIEEFIKTGVTDSKRYLVAPEKVTKKSALRPRIQPVSATLRRKASAAVWNPRHFLGKPFNQRSVLLT